MNEETYKIVAQSIVDANISHNFEFYALILLLGFLSSSFGGFVGSFFRTKGENRAIQADFKEILRRLGQSTQVSQEIKSQIETRFSDEQQKRALLREKLEGILLATFELEVWLQQKQFDGLDGKAPSLNSGPLGKIEMYESLYFPEVKVARLQLTTAVIDMHRWILDSTLEVQKARNEKRQANIDIAKSHELHRPIKNFLGELRKQIIEKYAPKAGL